MSADLIPFAYHATPVRVVTIDGEPWFVLADLCRVLTLSSPHKVYDRIADDAKGRTSIPTPGGDQQMAVVSEAGMYEVVIRSDKAEAVEFRRWITGTVLPEIRKTGSYGAPKLAELSRRDILTMALEAEDRADREAAARLEAESQVRELIPPASAWNALADTNGDYAVGDAAKILSRDPKIATGERRLFAFMKAIGWVFRRDGHWCAVSIPSPCGGAGVMGFVFTSSLPSQSLQRRARSRQVDVSAPRPVGTTTPGGAS